MCRRSYGKRLAISNKFYIQKQLNIRVEKPVKIRLSMLVIILFLMKR